MTDLGALYVDDLGVYLFYYLSVIKLLYYDWATLYAWLFSISSESPW
jgi:hypothetical protein